jgi:hypothetical protein
MLPMAKTTKTLKKNSTKTAAPAASSVPATAPTPKPAAIAASAVAPISTTQPAKPAFAGTGPIAPKPAPVAPAPKPAQPRPAPRSNHICLELVKPEAKSVFVAGSFNEWQPDKTPLLPAGNGRWVGDLSIKPGRHEYLFVVDGQWLPDPNAKETVSNPFGGQNSVLVVSE